MAHLPGFDILEKNNIKAIFNDGEKVNVLFSRPISPDDVSSLRDKGWSVVSGSHFTYQQYTEFHSEPDPEPTQEEVIEDEDRFENEGGSLGSGPVHPSANEYPEDY
jgi:hypothetical protein